MVHVNSAKQASCQLDNYFAFQLLLNFIKRALHSFTEVWTGSWRIFLRKFVQSVGSRDQENISNETSTKQVHFAIVTTLQVAFLRQMAELNFYSGVEITKINRVETVSYRRKLERLHKCASAATVMSWLDSQLGPAVRRILKWSQRAGIPCQWFNSFLNVCVFFGWYWVVDFFRQRMVSAI
jgi:hypothetical protein